MHNHDDKASTSNFHAIIVAAGSGNRYGTKTPKQYQKINNISLLRHSILAFLNVKTCQSVTVVTRSEDADMYHDAVKGLKITPPVIGGKDRDESVFNGLKSLPKLIDEDIVLIHDAARPCVQQEDIIQLLETMRHNRAATLATPVTSTLKNANNQDIIIGDTSREDLWNIQTPQGFRYKDILNAHEQKDQNKTYTDDTSLISAMGIEVKLVKGSSRNIKITHPEDFKLASAILSPQSTLTKTGLGYDVHAFDNNSTGPITLCGIQIEHERTLKGHSDADVALHAITDAILGAIGQGDIGQHFPPSDDTFKDMDSAIFLKKAHDLLSQQSGLINNIDQTIICEEPKIGPHAPKMRQRVSNILKTPESRINIKATTSEKLGFTGRKEGIAAQAIVTISLPASED